MNFRQYIHGHLPLVFFGANIALIWVLTNYSYPTDLLAESCDGKKPCPRWPVRWLIMIVIRSMLAALLAAWMSQWNAWIGAFTFMCAIGLPLIRSRMPPGYLAETEIAVNLLFAAGILWLANDFTSIPATIIRTRFIPGQVAAIKFVVAVVIYILRGGTHIVRGLLNKGRILPEHTISIESTSEGASKTEIDFAEYNRGRVIGNIERLILLTFVAIQAYQALAFLMAAKGLFRAKDLENKEFAEYFLVGTLVSSMVAITAGMWIQLILNL
jgi:hypothetical protein